jgi:hypothetical protein
MRASLLTRPAVWRAALDQAKQIHSELTAIRTHLADPSQPMPEPTPPLQVMLPSPHATAGPSVQLPTSANGVQPDTLEEDSSSSSSSSRSSEEAAAPGAVEALPLLLPAASAGQLPPGLRQRSGRGAGAS